MKKTLSFAAALSERLSLPGEALGQLKLSVAGSHRALIENHRGLLLCTPERIAVRGGRGSLSLQGTELRIEAMNERELFIIGKIIGAEWSEQEERA